jgi:hypothetical protein
MMIGRRKPVSDGDDMHSETVRLGIRRDSELNENSRAVLWKACWMTVVLVVEVAEGWTTRRSFGRRLLQDTRHKPIRAIHS